MTIRHESSLPAEVEGVILVALRLATEGPSVEMPPLVIAMQVVRALHRARLERTTTQAFLAKEALLLTSQIQLEVVATTVVQAATIQEAEEVQAMYLRVVLSPMTTGMAKENAL